MAPRKAKKICNKNNFCFCPMWTQISPPRWWVEVSRPVIACNLQTMEHAFEAKCSRRYAASRRSRFMDSKDLCQTPLPILDSIGHSIIQSPSPWHLFLVGALCGTNNPCAFIGSTSIMDHLLLQTVNDLNPSQAAA